MHFWIDKRSQTCGFSGRHRVPSSISSGGFSGGRHHRRHHHRRGGAIGAAAEFGVGSLGLGLCSSSSRINSHSQSHLKLMVTPVHRFQSIECVAGNTGRYHQHGSSHHRLSSSLHNHHHARQSSSNAHHMFSPSNYQQNNRSDSQHHTSAVTLEGNNGSNFLELSAINGNGTHRPSTSLEQTHHNMLASGGKLKCGMWASFAIVTVFMVGAKFYFNNQSTGMEMLTFCSLLVIVLFTGCSISLCKAVASNADRPLSPSMVIDSTGNRMLSPPPLHNRASTESLQHHTTGTGAQNNNPTQQHNGGNDDLIISMDQSQPQPPPPYHIAILLPQHQSTPDTGSSPQQHIIMIDDSSPPSYDKVVIS